VDKPAGVAVHGGSGVSFGVIEQLRRARPQARFLELVHRLDKQTSGVLLLAKKRSALTALQEQFRSRATDKTYAALVIGAWPASRKVIDVALHKSTAADGVRRVRAVDAGDAAGRRSITLVKVARRCEAYTLLDVTIKTGRTHQIRVHLTSIDHPILGDPLYKRRGGPPLVLPPDAPVPQRQALHALSVEFEHPATQKRVRFEAPLEADIEAMLVWLRANRPSGR
jgi:23S rRNA pseudouridine955/2504/2580 synthase